LVYLEDKKQGGEQYKSKNKPVLLAMSIWQVAMWVNHEGWILSERNIIIYMPVSQSFGDHGDQGDRADHGDQGDQGDHGDQISYVLISYLSQSFNYLAFIWAKSITLPLP